MSIDYEEVRDYYRGFNYNDERNKENSHIFSKIEELININEIKSFYPKNLFLDEKKLEVYIFFENKLLLGQNFKNDKVKIKIIDLNYLKEFKIESNWYEEGINRITLKLDQEEIVFNSLEDSNENWKYRFKEEINNIFQLLIKEH